MAKPSVSIAAELISVSLLLVCRRYVARWTPAERTHPGTNPSCPLNRAYTIQPGWATKPTSHPEGSRRPATHKPSNCVPVSTQAQAEGTPRADGLVRADRTISRHRVALTPTPATSGRPRVGHPIPLPAAASISPPSWPPRAQV